MKWLIPRLPRFQTAHPEIPLRVVESNGPFDFRADGVDLAIRMRTPGDSRSPDSVVTPFMDHFHGPVMSPELAAAGEASLSRICALPRLHTRTFPESWTDWARKVTPILPEPVSEQEFDHYFYMLEAAAAGLGVAIGPWAFVQRDLASGRLVAPLGFVAGQATIVALTPLEGVTEGAIVFRDWLVEEGRTTPMPPTSLAPSPEAACDSGVGR
jgi:DNA-binding transcriptional LysR family regulator